MVANQKKRAHDYKVSLKPLPVNEDMKFRWAVGLVGLILVLLVAASFAEVFGAVPGDNVFSKSIIVLPPMITLIIGYYFSHRKP